MSTYLVNSKLNAFQRFVLKLIGATPRIAAVFQRERESFSTTYELAADRYNRTTSEQASRLQTIYDQRNLLAIALAQLVPGSGWGRDDNAKWSDEWRTVVYLHLPRGQVTFHMHPKQGELARGNLPQYDGAWDASWWDKHEPVMTALIESLGDDLLRKEARHG